MRMRNVQYKPKVQALLKKLKTVPPGPIPEDDEIHVTQLLIDAWEELDGSMPIRLIHRPTASSV